MSSFYVFDAYGTLFDVHAAVRRHTDKIGPDGALLSQIWRAKQLEYSWVRALMGAYRDFWKITEDALDYAFDLVPSADRTLRSALLESYKQLDCYAEVPAVLRALKEQGARVAVLSNGSSAMLQSAIGHSALDSCIDEVFSTEALRTFKTAPEAYEMVTTHYRIYPAAVSFQSSNRWDIAGAAQFGFRTVWVNRGDMPDEYGDHTPDMVLPSLDGLVG